MKDKHIRVFLSARRNTEGLDIYNMKPNKNLGLAFSEARILIKEGNSKKGAPVIPVLYKESNIFFEPYPVEGKTKILLIVKKGNLSGIIDSDNQEVVPFVYEDIISLSRFKNTTIFVAKLEEEYGVFDLSGKLLLPRLFYSVRIVGAGKFELAGDDAKYEFDLENNTLKELVAESE